MAKRKARNSADNGAALSPPVDLQAELDAEQASDFIDTIASLEQVISERRREAREAKQALKKLRKDLQHAEDQLYRLLPATVVRETFIATLVERRRKLAALQDQYMKGLAKFSAAREARAKAQGELLNFIDRWTERLPLFDREEGGDRA